MAGRLYRMAKVVSANPNSWGIVDAKEISGFRRVASLAELYALPECILSSSYGDGVTDGEDAVGQIWHVSDIDSDYKLINWKKRGEAAGWTKLIYGGDVSVPVQDVKVDGTSVVSKGVANISLTPYAKAADVTSLTTRVSTAESEVTRLKSGLELTNSGLTSVTNKVTTLEGKVGKANGIATLDANGKIPLAQLGNLDTTLFEVVSELPSTTATIKKNRIYLVETTSKVITPNPLQKNIYAEYIYTGDLNETYDSGKWEKLGEYKSDTDLSNYYTKSEVYTKDQTDKKIIDYVNPTLTNVQNTLQAEINKKFDTISGDATPGSGQNVVTSITKGTGGKIIVTYGTALTAHQSLDGYVNAVAATTASEPAVSAKSFTVLNSISKSGKTVNSTKMTFEPITELEINNLT